jgi:hypothetical protein
LIPTRNRPVTVRFATILLIALAWVVCFAGKSRADAPDVSTLPLYVPTQKLTEPPPAPGDVLIVQTAMFVNNLIALDEVGETWTVNAHYKLQWVDPRLEQPDGGPADIRYFREGDVWIPLIGLPNQAGSFTPGNYLLSADSHGGVTYLRRFEAKLSTSFDLLRFPFDTQNLLLILRPSFQPGPLILLKDSGAFSGTSEESYAMLAEWQFSGLRGISESIRMPNSVRQVEQVRFELTVVRRYAFYIWKALVPLFAMAIVAWSIFWVRPDDFDHHVKIALTTMLTVVAFFLAISRDLPHISYLTFLGWGLLGELWVRLSYYRRDGSDLRIA